MDKAYYEEYFLNEREHWWFRAREKILQGQLALERQCGRLQPEALIANVGVATGRSSEWLAEYGTVTSLEYDSDCCRMTRERLGIDIVEGTILELPWESGTFDVACAFDVIEHVEDHQTAVNELLRVVKPGGLVVVTVPASRMLWSEHDAINHHFRRYSRHELQSLFRDSQILRCMGFNSILFAPIAIHRLSRRFFSPPANAQLTSDFARSRFSWGGSILGKVFGMERLWLDRGFGPPWGVSALLVARALPAS